MKKKIRSYLILAFLSVMMLGVTNELDTLQLIPIFFYIYMSVVFAFGTTFFLYQAYVTAKKLEKSLRE